MSRNDRILLTIACAIVSVLGTTRWFWLKPVHAQQNQDVYDDGTFYISAYVDVDNNYNLYLDSYMDVEEDLEEDIDAIEVDATADEDGTAYYEAANDGDDFTPAEVQLDSSSPVATGHEYGIESDGYACFDDGEGDCNFEYISTAYTSVFVPSPPPQITSISPASVTQGDQGTLTITGSNFIENSGDQLSINFSGPTNPFTLTSTPSPCTASCTATFSYNFSGYPTGSYQLSVSNNEHTSNNESFTVLSTPPPPNPCAVASNPQAGYTSIVSTGTAGGSGTLAVSFSGTAFAAINPTVTYGPYSTPSSLASNIAALITRNYLQYGLSAKAFGPNIVYSGNTTLGTVSNVTTGSSISTTTSSTSATATENACESAPPPPPAGLSCSSVTRGGTTTCVANGGAVSNWSFTDGTNTVKRTSTPTSPTWAGVMATSGTVSVTVAGTQMTASITVSPRAGFAFAAASAMQQTNPYTDACSNVLSVDSTPMAPAAGGTETLGIFGLCQGSSFNDLQINSGPNSGYSFFTSATNGTQFNWVGAQDILNPSSVFYGKQCGNYNPSTNVGFISGANLSTNLIRHESSATAGQGHYGNYMAAQNLPSLNIGTTYEALIVFGSLSALQASANGKVGSNQNAIFTATQIEPPQPQYNGFGVFLGNINYPPYAPPTAVPTCP